MVKETKFEQTFCKALRQLAPGDVIVLKNNSAVVQGIPDRQVLYRDKFVFMEFKRSANAQLQANQEWYIKHFNKHGLALFVEPGNADESMDKICSYLGLNNNSKFGGKL